MESLLSSPNRAIIVQRMVHGRTRSLRSISSLALGDWHGGEINIDKAEAKLSEDSGFLKRDDSHGLWKVGAHVSAANAASIGSVYYNLNARRLNLTRLLHFY